MKSFSIFQVKLYDIGGVCSHNLSTMGIDVTVNPNALNFAGNKRIREVATNVVTFD